MTDDVKLYSLAEISEKKLIPLSVVTLRRYVKQKILPHRKIGRNRIYLTKLDIDNFITNSFVPIKNGGEK